MKDALPWAIASASLGSVISGAILVDSHPTISVVLGFVGVTLWTVLLWGGRLRP